MNPDDQFHVNPFWPETSVNDVLSPFPDVFRFPFEEQVPSPIPQNPFDGFQLSPTLLPKNSTPISSFKTDDKELPVREKPTLSKPHFETSTSSELKLSKAKSNPIPQPIFLSENSTQIANLGSNPLSSATNSQTLFFDKLSKVLDKPLTREQIQLITSLLPTLTHSLNLNPNANNSNYPPKNPYSTYGSFRTSVNQSNHKGADVDFNIICPDTDFVIYPQKLGFIPENLWVDKELTFGALVTTFFQKRNNASSRFSHKLFNALRLSTEHPHLIPYIGVEWITPTILKVNKFAFARLLKIKTIDGSLFHHQGNFPSHGFVEINEKEACGILPPEVLSDVDYESVRLLTHPAGIFRRDCTGSDIDNCKWINCRRK